MQLRILQTKFNPELRIFWRFARQHRKYTSHREDKTYVPTYFGGADEVLSRHCPLNPYPIQRRLRRDLPRRKRYKQLQWRNLSQRRQGLRRDDPISTGQSRLLQTYGLYYHIFVSPTLNATAFGSL